MEMMHPAHQHLLILNEIYIAKEGDFCIGCREQIDSCKSFVYSCSNIKSTTSTNTIEILCVQFLLHKTCAKLPPQIVNPTDQKEFLLFKSVPDLPIYLRPSISYRFTCCAICGLPWEWFSYCNSTNDILNCIYICFKCALFQVQQSKEDTKIEHPGHSHPLALIEHPSSFKCYACKVNDNILDLSYRCTKCQFWMHKSCGDAPTTFQFQFHDKHPLTLLFSLPQRFRRFAQICRLCNEPLNQIDWLYCCRRCRFFTHFHCARSSSMLRSSENETYPNLVQLPPPDESSRNRLLDQFVQDMITLYNSCNNGSIVSTGNFIKHWTHEEHDLKLISINELYDRENDDEILLLCDGCVRPIGTTDDSLFYSCVPCKYFMHKVCAELPTELPHHLWPATTLFAKKPSQPFHFFWCAACYSYGNGIFFCVNDDIKLHIGCVALPKIIKHEAHPHQLDQVYDQMRDYTCNSCRFRHRKCKYGCKKCNFYICGRCIMSARTIKHMWDPHPLDLIYDAGMVTDHEHDFDCEYCSAEIDTNEWFYNCRICDLSFHNYYPSCHKLSLLRQYEYVKFGASDIKRDELHRHPLTFVLNKKVRRCGKCGEGVQGQPVLQCAPCNTVICRRCY